MKMRSIMLLALVVLALGLCAVPVTAQAVPGGSYQQTCKNIKVSGGTLYARCQDGQGGWNNSSLYYQNCSGEVVNSYGSLTCSGNGYSNGYGDRRWDRDRDRDRQYGYNNGYNYPAGNYVQTCRNIRVDGNQLEAECERGNGSWRRTSLNNVNQCRDIENNNGRLVCTRGGYGYYGNNNGYYNNGYGNYSNGAPSGSYLQTCRNVRSNGSDLYGECQTADGGWRRSTLRSANQCRSDIQNVDGRLECGRW